MKGRWEYMVIIEDGRYQFEKMVMIALDDGWWFRGGMIHWVSENKDCFAQGMSRERPASKCETPEPPA